MLVKFSKKVPFGGKGNLGSIWAKTMQLVIGCIMVSTPLKNCIPPPLTLLFSSNLFSKLRSYQAPLFENLEGGSTPPPQQKGVGGEGCTLCFGKMGNLDPI